MTSRYRKIIRHITPARLFAIVLVIGLYLLLIRSTYGYNVDNPCSISQGCLPVKLPSFWSLISTGPVWYQVYRIQLVELIGGLWFYGMINMFLVLERKKLDFQDNSTKPKGYELVQHKN